jgi:hypothetical protein
MKNLYSRALASRGKEDNATRYNRAGAWGTPAIRQREELPMLATRQEKSCNHDK